MVVEWMPESLWTRPKCLTGTRDIEICCWFPFGVSGVVAHKLHSPSHNHNFGTSGPHHDGPGLSLERCLRRCGGRAWNLLDGGVHGDPTPLRDLDVLIGTTRLARQTQNRIAVLQ